MSKRKYFGTVRWTKDDIRSLCLNIDDKEDLTDKQIDDFIQQNEGYFEELMIERGWDIWESLILQYKRQLKDG